MKFCFWATPLPNPLMKQLAIRLGHQKTVPKSLVSPPGEREFK